MAEPKQHRIESPWRMVVAVVLDPPGWVPAWALTAALVYLAVNAASVNDPQRLEVLRVVADTYKVVLAIWLGYKGLGAFASFLTSWLAPKHQERVDQREGTEA